MSFNKIGFNKILGAFPTLERDERLELVQQLEENAQANIDFIMMMVLSTSLASLGLLADSTAVVIGAMLVAPLMGPLVAAGCSLVQGNFSLFRRSLAVTLIGIGIGFAASLIFGALNPGFEPTLEIEARGKADLLDLGIAFFSGMTAAYAIGRSHVMTTIAGVAIAAALVPPLAVVGLALTHGRPLISYNAAILLTTNLVAIILGAAIVFRILQVHVSRQGAGLPIWVRRATMLLFLLLALLIAPLVGQMIEGRRTGQDRPVEYQLAPHVREAVQKYISDWPEVELITQGRNSVEPEAAITIILMSGRKLAPDFEEGLRSVVQKARGDEPLVRIFPILAARQRMPEHQDDTQ
ncbi:MAG: DUF389 domain-containing protein [Desulfobacterales bacterium]|jgi:uncharacterized hydrophobic protein (TIGR00271 family)